MSSEADGDDAFSMHLGVLGRKELSFSERLRQARQLDALLESFSDAEDSGDDEWAGSVRSVSAALPRGTVAVAAARRPALPSWPAAKHPCSPAHPESPGSSSLMDAASAATTRVASGYSSSASTQGHDGGTSYQSLPQPIAVAGAQVWAAAEEEHAQGLGALLPEAREEAERRRPPRLGSARRLRPSSRDGSRETPQAARYGY